MGNKSPKYRLSTLLGVTLLIALLLGFYALKRDGTRRAWAAVDGVWKLDEMIVDGETLDTSESHLRIEGSKVIYLFGNDLVSGSVKPSLTGIDLIYSDGYLARGLFDSQDGKLRILHTKDGSTRPSRIPDLPALHADHILMTFIRDDSFDFDQVLARRSD